MAEFEHALLLLLAVAGLSVVGRFVPVPRPITYVLGGIALAFLPGFPAVRLDPEFFFLCFLPPLLFSDGWLMPLREFRQSRRPILILATGLVVLTTAVVGLVAHALVPSLPWAMAFALGAVVSPTDAVATDAITESLSVPTRVTIVLKGESLMNDATGLVAFKFALAAMAVGAFSVSQMALEFLVLSLGGFALGLAVAYGVGRIRDLVKAMQGDDPLIEVTLSLLTPYAAYLAGEALHASGVLAIVAAGLYSGWRDPVKMNAETRQLTWSVWSTVLFWMNGVAFVLLGLQLPELLHGVGDQSVATLTLDALLLAGAAMLLRIAWFFPGAYLPFLLSRRVRATEDRPSWRAVLVGGWAGMRGAVTLAAALSIPLVLPSGAPFPGRNVVIFLSFGVIATTLLVQGTSLAALIRWLGLRADGIREREEQIARTAAVRAGLATLRAAAAGAGSVEQSSALGHVVAEYEQRLAELVEEGSARSNAQERRSSERRYRQAALDAERQALDELWRRREISDEVHRPLQHLLDHEERMLAADGGTEL